MAGRKNVTPLLRYFAIVGVYLVCLSALKVIELFAFGIAISGGVRLPVMALAYNWEFASWAALAVGLLYGLLYFLSAKVAVRVAAGLYAILLLSEVCLSIYVAHNGFLLGSELLARPFGETLLAVKGAMGLVMPIVLSVLLLGCFYAVAIWRSIRPTRAAWMAAAVVSAMLLLSIIFKPSNLVVDRYAYYILNKVQYLAVDCHEYLRHSRDFRSAEEEPVAYDGVLVAELLATHPEWGTPCDMRYPLEREAVADTFLNPYFKVAEKGVVAPNVVIVLVESLGAELMGSGAMPFVDSLAATGLYWPNCLSTTTRSYGAVPGITGSVGGPRSFQLGIMPDHNTLFSLLKAAGYNTRAYYTGDFNFDCVYEYLAAQRVDYLSPIFQESSKLPSRNYNNWWGYEDDTLFARAGRELDAHARQHPSEPHLSLITTMSMHDPLNLRNRAVQSDCERRAARLPQMGANLAPIAAACVFTDDCLRQFFDDYRRIPGYENTLFVITGDHATGRQNGDKLSYHHVPLILWSPLVQQPATFRHTVTHNDVAPAIYGLLTAHYGLTAHPTVHWLGDGLDDTPKTLAVVSYVRDIKDVIFHDHYYQSSDGLHPEALYEFGDDLRLHPCDDTAVLDSCRRQLELLRYLYTYTYCANRLTSHPIVARHYTVMHTDILPTVIDCTYPEGSSELPSGEERDIVPIIQLKRSKGYSTVRVTVAADAVVKGDLSSRQYPDLIFCCWGEDGQQWYSEPLIKFISDGGRVKATKEFPIGGDEKGCLKVVAKMPDYSKDWKLGDGVTLSNIQIIIEYGK